MRLSEFIRTHLEQILAEWEGYARSRAPATAGWDGSIRDHADAMLRAIADELDAPEREPNPIHLAMHSSGSADAEAAAEAHGAGRAEYGFTLEQMLTELRVLRAVVIAGWRRELGTVTVDEFDDLRRFDAAIGQTLTASVSRFMKEADHAKETFLGILGHDLKTPLSAVIMSARFLLDNDHLEEEQKALLARIESSASRMSQMVSDLLDYTRTRLGRGIPIERESTDLSRVIHDAVDELKVAHPQRTVHVDVTGTLTGSWDPKRLSQALSNLLGNAIHHGDEQTAVSVAARSFDDAVSIAVHNNGPAIRPDRIAQIFNPLSRTIADPGSHDPAHLGLGLYIANAIATAHGGRIDVESSEEAGTTFTVHLPKQD